MELYEAIEKRRTTRQFLDKEVDFEAIKRILKAGTKAPTWDHNRRWEFIVLHTDEEKEYAFEYAKKLAAKFNADRYLNMPPIRSHSDRKCTATPCRGSFRC